MSSATQPAGDSEGPRPTPHEAALLLLLVVCLSVAVGYPLQSLALIPGVLTTEWLLVAGPVMLFVRLRGLSPIPTLRLVRPSKGVIVGTLLAGGSGWYVVGLMVEQLQNRVFPVPPEVTQQMQALVAGSARPLALDLLALAVSPAICEELLFRGFLLRATEWQWPAPLAVALNGVLFGVFHLSPYRLLPTTVLGFVLALLALRSRSVVPAMLFHLLNNTMTLLIGRYVVSGGAGLEVEPLHAVLATSVFAVGLVLTLRASVSRSAGGR